MVTQTIPMGCTSALKPPVAPPIKPLHLLAPKLGLITKGGYIVSYDKDAPKDCDVIFYIGPTDPPKVMDNLVINDACLLDITNRSRKDIFDADNLPDLLAKIKQQKLFGKSARCALYLKRGGKYLNVSNVQSIACPIAPIPGPLNPDLGNNEDGVKMTYTGIQTGRMLHDESFNGDHYFKFAGLFETDNNKRGLNCITYVGAVYAVDSSTGAMSAYGTKLADELDATKCDMEGKKEKEIKAFFSTHDSGNYIMWSASHVVLVVDAVVHEFSLSKNGYAVTDVDEWNYHGATYWVRKVDREFGA